MSDISTSDAGSVSEAPVTESATPESADFDLDAAVEEFANSAPDEWKGKASKIQSELKSLRGKYAPFRDAFDGIVETDRDAVFNLLQGLKSGNTEGVATWMISAAKGVAGDRFDDIMKGLSPAEQAEAIEKLAEASDEEAPEQELSIDERIAKALEDRDKAHAEKLQAAERQSAIDNQFTELGLSIERNEQGRLKDFTSQQVAMLAINDHGGDLKAAHEAYNAWRRDQAVAYLKENSNDPTLSPSGGSATAAGDPGTKEMTAKEKAKARILRAAQGPQA